MRLFRAASLLVILTVAGHAASAAELKVLTTGAFKPVVTMLVADYERQSGDKVTVANDTAGALVKRIEGGETFDVVVLTPAALTELTGKGKVAAGSSKNLARVAIGVAVKDGAPKPDIGTVDAFKQTLLKAKSVAYIDPAAGGSSGIYLDKLFQRLGIADAIRPKAVLVPGGLVAERVVKGEAEIGVHQISEILAVKGATLVGPLPAEIQNYTVYAGGVSATTAHADAAKKLLAVFSGDAAQRVLKDKGMESAPN